MQRSGPGYTRTADWVAVVAGTAAMVVTAGCGPSPDRIDPRAPFRPYDTSVQCAGPYYEVLQVEDAIGRLDMDGDLAITSDDLLEGEAVFVLRVSGMHADSGAESHPGVSIHADWGAYVERKGSEWVLHATADCMPTARIMLSFGAADVGQGEPYAVSLTDFAFHVVDRDAATTGDVSLEGGVTGTMGNSALSGVLDGSVSGAIHSQVPEEAGLAELTGQTVHIEALAFRAIEVLQ